MIDICDADMGKAKSCVMDSGFVKHSRGCDAESGAPGMRWSSALASSHSCASHASQRLTVLATA
jgi:hypothetical protein